MSERGEQEKPFEIPAKIRPEHFIENPEAPVKWQRWGVKDETPLGLAHAKGRLDAGGRRGHTGEDRYKAALVYRAIWDTVHSTSGSTKFERVGGSTQEARTAETVCIARDLQKRVEERMSRDNAFLVRCFVGEGSSGSEAVKARMAGFKDTVWAQICVALDDLIDAVVALGLHRMSAA